MLIETHNPYRPSVVDWPILEPEARNRLVSLPIWDIAMQTEGNASLRVLSYAETIEHPLLREAVKINGFEEIRHKQVLSNLVGTYSIPRQNRNTCLRDIPSGRSCSPVFASASTLSSPLACLRWLSDQDFFRPLPLRPSSRWYRGKVAIFSFSSIGWLGTAATCRRGDAFSSRSKSSLSGPFLFGRGSASHANVPAVHRREGAPRQQLRFHRQQGDRGY